MSSRRDPEEDGVLAGFLRVYLADRSAGRLRDLHHYQKLFPGFDQAIAVEWQSLAEGPIDGSAASEDPAPQGSPAVADRWPRHREIDSPEDTAPELIGEGGMGAVYKVWDRRLRRHVAKKVLRLRADRSSAAQQRFVDEAQITGQLSHPGIVPVHQVGTDSDGRLYFTMVLVRGDNFKEVIRRVHEPAPPQQAGADASWTLARAVGVVQRLCDAVGFAHDKGVLHRDIKPSNLMVGRFGEAYVMDWGLARVMGPTDGRDRQVRAGAPGLSSVHTVGSKGRQEEPDSPLYTMDGDVVGTPAYMAPEQAGGEVERVGPTADVYSLGAVLYHLICGHAPYVPAGVRVSSRALLARVVDGPPAPLRREAPRAPAALVAIVERAMARDPSRRYPTAQALGEDLRSYLEHRVVQAHRTGAVAELGQWIGRNRVAAGALGLALGALAWGTLWSLAERRRAEGHAIAARAAERTAGRQADAAVRNFEVAFGAGQALVDTVLSPEMRRLPGSDGALRFLGDTAERYVRSLIRVEGDDPRVRMRAAQAYLKLAMLHHHLQRWPEGIAAANEAAHRLARERGSPLWKEIHDHELCMAHVLGGLARYRSAADEAALLNLESVLRRARGLALDLRQEEGDLPFLAYDNLTVVLAQLASHHLSEGRVALATRMQEEAVEVAERATIHHGDRKASWELLGNTRHALAQNLRSKTSVDEGIRQRVMDLYAGAQAAAEAGLERWPEDRDLLGVLGRSCFDLGTERMKWVADDAARPLLERAVEVLSGLATAHPEDGNVALNLGGARCNLAGLIHRAGDTRAGAALAEAGVEPLIRAAAQRVQAADQFLRNTCGRAANLWIRAGEPARAAVQIRVMVGALPRPDVVDYGARLMADCAVAAREPESRVGGYWSEAIEMLRRAVQLGHRMPATRTGPYVNFAGVPGFDALLRQN